MRYELPRQDEPMVISVVTAEYKVERVTIKGVIELETMFGEQTHARTIPVLYIIVDVDASYNIIMGKPALNSLRIGSQPSQARETNVNVLDLDLDPRCKDKHERPLPAKDLKEVSIGPKLAHKTKIRTTMAQEDKSHLVAILRENRDVFAWSSTDMLGIDPDFLCHHLSIFLGYRPVAQQRRKLGEEKQKAA
ncbi:hypothetical protein CR513_27836, partial [Mucuna pruriens]